MSSGLEITLTDQRIEEFGIALTKTKDLENEIGTLSKPSKMPGHGWSTPAKNCITGSKLAKVANSICSICYARKGRYVFKNVAKALAKRLKAWQTVDNWHLKIAELIKRKQKSGNFRWDDSGDIQSVKHLRDIVLVAELLPQINFWLPTREYSFVREYKKQFGSFPKNLCVRLSAFMINGKPPVAVAKRLGLPTSGVVEKGFNCPAPKQQNKCGDCRACWDNKVENINYNKH